MPTKLILACERATDSDEHLRVALPLPFDAATLASLLRRDPRCPCGARAVVTSAAETPQRVTPENATAFALTSAIRAAHTGRAFVDWMAQLLTAGAFADARRVILSLGDATMHPDLAPPEDPALEGSRAAVHEWWFAMMAQYARAILPTSGVENFVMTADEGDPEGVEVILRRRRGKSPVTMIRELRAEVAMLRRGFITERPGAHKYLSPVFTPRPFTEAAVACDPAAVEAFAAAVAGVHDHAARLAEAAERVPGVAGAERYVDCRGFVWGFAGPSCTAPEARVFVVCDDRGEAADGDDAREILHLPGDAAAVIGRGTKLYLVTESLRSDDLARDAFDRMVPRERAPAESAP